MKVKTVGYECGDCALCGQPTHGPALVRREDVVKWLRERADGNDDGPPLHRAADALEADGA